jgi:hypothetical protein
MAQVVEYMPSKHKALSSNIVLPKKKKKKKILELSLQSKRTLCIYLEKFKFIPHFHSLSYVSILFFRDTT